MKSIKKNLFLAILDGFPFNNQNGCLFKYFSEKALAATGNSSAEKAMNWLVSHINDPRLDEATMREYALYAIPIGTFGEQLLNFWYDSRELCAWNAGHNRLPHVTIVSFFKVKFIFTIKMSVF